MSEYGLKILNYEAGSIHDFDLGLRDCYDTTDAMLTNSLFSDFLKKNGLQVWRNKSTRDVICLKFNYGTHTYEEELKKLDRLEKEVQNDKTLSETAREKKLTLLGTLRQKYEDKKAVFVKRTKQELRELYYENGVDIKYQTHNRDGKVIREDVIHYRMLYRTPGKAKKGECMFINERLYDKAREFLYMGIQLPPENTPIVEIGAYSSLITSSIVGRICIPPEHILLIKDVDSFFRTKVVSIGVDEYNHCTAKAIDDYELKNTMFDGQALIESSIFPDWGEGYILLRHHFCKCAAFKTNIAQFMKDHYGDQYETATVKDMFGNDRKVKDIWLITTENAMKWTKFDVTYEYWCDWVRKNGSMFGIVKTAHPSKLGRVQRMSYQMINALDMESMPRVVECSLEYIRQLKTDMDVFLDYLRDNVTFSNDFDVLLALVEQNPEFVRSQYFRERRNKIISNYILDFRNGHVIQYADNLVIVGSPYAMLLHSVGEDPLSDPTFCTESDAIQCFTQRFADGKHLAGFRSPFNSKNNMSHLHNVYHPFLQTYFDFGEQIIAVNMNHTDCQDRNNGSDQDSDSLYVTDFDAIVECARSCYINYPTIVNNIPKEKNIYSLSMKNFALVDNNLAAASLAIGESSNLAQLCLTYTYNYDDPKYSDEVCILSVLAQIAIDSAKRRFVIDTPAEIARLKKDMAINTHGYPAFWTVVHPGFLKSKINTELICPMNYIRTVKIESYRPIEPTLPMSDFFINHGVGSERRQSRKVEDWIERYGIELYNFNVQSSSERSMTEYLLLREDFQEMVEDIRKLYISRNYLCLMSWLINRALCVSGAVRGRKATMQSTLSKNRSLLLKTLFVVNKRAFLKCFTNSKC